MKDDGRGGAVPLPLLIGFGLFLAAMAYLVASSLTRRTAPTFAPTAQGRVRAAGWERTGDTLTVDAKDGERWRYVSLGSGRVLGPRDTADWEVAVRRYHLVIGAAAADLGPALFDTVRVAPAGGFAAATVPAAGPEAQRTVAERWYRYSLLTHLLESNRHVYAVRTPRGDYFKLQVLSYYCPGLTAGCMTIRYAPLAAPRPTAARRASPPS